MKTSFEFADNILGVLIDREIDIDMMENIEKMLKQKMKSFSDVRIYVEDQYKNGISLKALMEHVSFHFTDTVSLKKVAVVTDKKFFEAVMKIKDKLVTTEVETFSTSDRVQAMNWVMQ